MPQLTEIRLVISRFKPGLIDPPRWMSYDISVDRHMSILDGLTYIRLHRDPTLMHRHSCHHSSCGTCACRINGTERLACITPILSLNSKEIILEPLAGLPRLGDLVVEMQGFYRYMDPDWTGLRDSEPLGDRNRPRRPPTSRFENCIECGSCRSACPVPQDGSPAFMGPAALAAIHREIRNRPQKTDKLLKHAAGTGGVQQCRKALACSRVCPTRVYPARHIIELKKRLE